MTLMKLPIVTNAKQLEELVEDLGFLPFFTNEIMGFSVEECCPKEYWFTDIPGPWEWKSEIAQGKHIAYGKFFGKKAGYIAHRFIPHFCNYRRDGYDFDALYDDGKATRKSKDIIDLLEKNGSMLSREIKKTLGYKKGGNTGFDTVITALQMQGYVAPVGFELSRDKDGKEYGWGVARYDTFERIFGSDFVTSEYDTDPMDSREILVNNLIRIAGPVTEKQINKIIGKKG